jgi:hypothetical protein
MITLGKDAQAKLAAKTLRIAVAARNELIKAASSLEHVFAGAAVATTSLTVGDEADGWPK